MTQQQTSRGWLAGAWSRDHYVITVTSQRHVGSLVIFNRSTYIRSLPH